MLSALSLALFTCIPSLEIEVASAALMYELDSFHKSSLLEALGQQPGLEINGLKFRLKGSLGEAVGGGQ